MKQDILCKLSSRYPWKEQFHYFQEINSTNDHLKSMARHGAPHGTVVIAGQQTGGRGRMGRSFHSPDGMGVYLSVLLRPDCSPGDLMHLTCAAAVAMCNAIEAVCGIRPGIKWTNDLVWNKQKLGGILTELGFGANGQLDYAIIGIGINCCQHHEDFPSDIRHIAGSLSMVSSQDIDRSAVAAAMMDSLYTMNENLFTGKEEMLEEYRRSCITLGQDISILQGSNVRYGHALNVDDNGALVVLLSDGTVETVNSGEVSVRGMYGYI